MFYHALTSGNLEPVLLWTNPNPTSEFVSQQIEIDGLDNYGSILVEFYKTISDSTILNGYSAGENSIVGFISNNETHQTNTRRVAKIDGAVSFSEASAISTSAYSIQNAYVIPNKIYGIKEWR